MDVKVRTGSTKAPRDISLVSLSLESLHGERVVLLVEVTAEERDAHAIEREAEAILKHALLEAEGEASERLDSALKELNGLLKGMLVSGAVHDVHMLISILDNQGVMHVSHAGRAEAYLIRKGSASQVTEYNLGKPTPAFVHIASGQLEEGDLVICSTQRLLRTFTPAQLAKLTAERDGVIDAISRALEAEGDHAATAMIDVIGVSVMMMDEEEPEQRPALSDRRQRLQHANRRSIPGIQALPFLASLAGKASSFLPSRQSMNSIGGMGKSAARRGGTAVASLPGAWAAASSWFNGLLADLQHPQRKKRAHLLLIAGAIALLLVVWAMVHLFTSSQRSKTRAELETLVEQISVQIQTAENRSLMGEADSANTILQQAEERAKQVMDNESGLFRGEAANLLEQIRSKKEEINNITRVQPRVVANIAANNPDVLARGLIGMGDGEFVAYDKQDVYRVLLNAVEAPSRISDDVLIIDGVSLSRFQVLAFLMNGNSLIEWQNGQSVSMKTDDTRGWVNGIAIDAYLRFLYILSPENKQIYKYERLNDRYGIPAEYNVNGDLTGAIDIAIDGNVYILKDTGEILKLFRGEKQNFTVRGKPDDAFDNVTKLFKIVDRNFYALDPEQNRVIVFTDGGATGESVYQKQYVFEGEQVGELQDLYVDADESHLYVMDEKRVYVVDLTTR